MTELKPCPACGNAAEVGDGLDDFGEHRLNIQCTGCLIQTASVRVKDRKLVIADWNRRTSPEIDEAREIIGDLVSLAEQVMRESSEESDIDGELAEARQWLEKHALQLGTLNPKEKTCAEAELRTKE